MKRTFGIFRNRTGSSISNKDCFVFFVRNILISPQTYFLSSFPIPDRILEAQFCQKIISPFFSYLRKMHINFNEKWRLLQVRRIHHKLLKHHVGRVNLSWKTIAEKLAANLESNTSPWVYSFDTLTFSLCLCNE